MHYELKNHMETIVDQDLRKLMAENDMCDCDRCYIDTMALALNHLPPKYVITRVGELMTEIDATVVQQQADVLGAILNAIKIVKNKPSHET